MTLYESLLNKFEQRASTISGLVEKHNLCNSLKSVDCWDDESLTNSIESAKKELSALAAKMAILTVELEARQEAGNK